MTEALGQIGAAYYNLEKYDKARPIYQYVVDNWAQKPRDIRIHRSLVRTYIYLEDYDSARRQLQLLTERYGENENLPRVLNEIAKGYREQKLYDQAEPVSQYVLDNRPQSDQCLWAQKSVILCRLGLADKESAKAATDTLLSKFSTHRNAKQAIADVAQVYRDLRMYGPARDLYKFNLARYPESKEAIWWLRAFVNQSAELGDDASVNAGIEKLLTQFSSNKRAPEVVYQVARRLSDKNDQRSQKLYEYVIDKFSDSEVVALARTGIGVIELEHGDDGAARVIFDKVLADFAGHPVLPRAVDQMAYGYYRKALSKNKGRIG